MKKIFIGLALLSLSSCLYMQGDYTLGARNTFNDSFYTYAINYYDLDDVDGVEKETETVNDYKIGAVKQAAVGAVMVSSKLISKDVFSTEVVRPNMKGGMVSYTVPIEFSDEKVYQTIGETKIKGKNLRLIEPNRFGDVVLIDEQGHIYPRVGRIYNNRLALLNTSFLLEPENLKFENDSNKHFDEEGIISGFEVRYLGLQDDQMLFDFVTIEPDGSTMVEQHKSYRFPITDRNISLDGMLFEILNVNNSGIEYRLLSI